VRGGNNPLITQVAASVVGSAKEFSLYVYPKVPIACSAQQITGIVHNNSGTMTVHGQQAHAENLKTAIDKFCSWLRKLSNVYLVAHNGRTFDFPVLMNSQLNIQCETQFMDCVKGCIDSINVFKKAFAGQSTYKQEDLARTFLHTTSEAHNAMEDVKILCQLISHTKMDAQEIAAHSFPPSAVHNQLRFNREKVKNIKSLHPLVGSGVLKMGTAEKVAGSGLNLIHLKKIFERDGEDGLRNIFSCKNCDGLPRVTNTKKTLEEIVPKLCKFFSS
jgi:DNA polymerase III alpha subunit (gram-positive type)